MRVQTGRVSTGTDVLAVEGRPPMAPRRRAALLAVLLVAVTGALLVDLTRRDAEATAVAECRDRASTSMRDAGDPMWAEAALVRPALPRAGDDVRRELYALLSGRAATAEQQLAAARRACEGSVLWYHRALRERRDDCLADLDAQLAWYAEVVRDGRVAFSPFPAPTRCG